jgi:hypothetical protein
MFIAEELTGKRLSEIALLPAFIVIIFGISFILMPSILVHIKYKHSQRGKT